MAPNPELPPGLSVLERGWLSSNSVIGVGPEGVTLVDSGYCSHARQTLALLAQALQGKTLERLCNTHLHSDHCGGNAALQACYPGLHTAVPPGEADAVRHWDEDRLSYRATGQNCPRFGFDSLLAPGTEVVLAGRPWQVLAAPGHDPHAVLLFQPEYRTLISGDALWENGFGVVFPALDDANGFQEVAATLQLIASLSPLVVIPGHGAVFGGAESVAQALARARSRLDQFQAAPEKHRRYAQKVLLKFKLLEWQRVRLSDLMQWARGTPVLQSLHTRHGQGQDIDHGLRDLLDELASSGAAVVQDGWVMNR